MNTLAKYNKNQYDKLKVMFGDNVMCIKRMENLLVDDAEEFKWAEIDAFIAEDMIIDTHGNVVYTDTKLKDTKTSGGITSLRYKDKLYIYIGMMGKLIDCSEIGKSIDNVFKVGYISDAGNVESIGNKFYFGKCGISFEVQNNSNRNTVQNVLVLQNEVIDFTIEFPIRACKVIKFGRWIIMQTQDIAATPSYSENHAKVMVYDIETKDKYTTSGANKAYFVLDKNEKVKEFAIDGTINVVKSNGLSENKSNCVIRFTEEGIQRDKITWESIIFTLQNERSTIYSCQNAVLANLMGDAGMVCYLGK